MKSIDANIRRGMDSLAKALNEKTTVHRAMFRNGMGWVDFEWGSEGGRIRPNGKRPGGKSISHILEARQRKNSLTEPETIALLERLVTTIASGTERNRTDFNGGINVMLEHGSMRVALVKRAGSNAWVVTGWDENNPVANGTGDAESVATSSLSAPTRQGDGAGVEFNCEPEID